MCETWVAAQPTLKIAADVLYETVSTTDEQEAKILHGKQPPKTEENEMATKIDPAPCHTLKCPNLSIYQASKQKLLPERMTKNYPKIKIIRQFRRQNFRYRAEHSSVKFKFQKSKPSLDKHFFFANKES
jgi:hypothetical protein